MPSRRAHKKSRLGCLECKKRKVKCTEARPLCSYCIRSSCPCVYPDSVLASAPKSSPQSISSLSPKSFAAIDDSANTFDLLDLTLMNHFTAVTALVLFSGEQQKHVWQTDIHLKARTNPILMHGILSVAALHLAFTEPQNAFQYRHRALHHHDRGVRLFNQQLVEITPENTHVLFPFAVMLVVWAYASPIIADDELQLVDIYGLLQLVRGCRTLFMMHLDSIKNTPMGSITDFRLEPKSYQVVVSYGALRAFEHLRLKVLDPVYEPAIRQLENVFMKSISEPDDVRTVVSWPCIIEEVWSRFRANETAAHFLLAHYAMLLERYEGLWWWINGWSTRILNAVERVLSDADKKAFGWDIFLTHLEEHRREFLDGSTSVE
ncbi:hypothetical protein VTL71DRAFT_15588 [Oculimacula yallundae]|uniref:Zn(2)-C6 fungal-type domain-containing protein n=1 Tax=Oculimacula yallundae TaxID=86028 RepID=A0ABR4CHR1_9HELO